MCCGRRAEEPVAQRRRSPPRSPPGRRLRPASSCSPSGVGDVADREGLGAAGGLAALRVERVERLRGRRRAGSSAPEIRIGARTGAAIRTEAAIAPGQSSSSTRVTAAGRCAGVGRGEDGERDAGGVGGRVGAADPGRVVGREGRVAELFGRLGARASAPSALAVGAGAGAGAGLPELALLAPPPPRTAATMKTTATRTSAGDRLQRRRDRLARGAWRRLRRGGARPGLGLRPASASGGGLGARRLGSAGLPAAPAPARRR